MTAADGLHLVCPCLGKPDDGGDSGTACIALHSSDTSSTLYVEGLTVDDSDNDIEVATGDTEIRPDQDFRTVGTWSHGFSYASCGI